MCFISHLIENLIDHKLFFIKDFKSFRVLSYNYVLRAITIIY